MRTAILVVLVALLGAACIGHMPATDPNELLSEALHRVPAGMLERCEAEGALILLDERYEDYRARNYDNYKVRLLHQMGVTGKMTIPDAIRRTVYKILSKQGARRAARFEVIHFQELVPPVWVRAWTADGRQRQMNVQARGTRPLADWPCRMGYPRATAFRIGPLNPGDTVEVAYPLSGPEQELWRFADQRFCTLRSRATFGHDHDTGSTILDMDAVLYDNTGAARRVSPAGEHPVVWALDKPLPRLPPERIPFVARASRCRGFAYQNGRVFHLPIWMARHGDLSGTARALARPAEGARTERIHAVGAWLSSLALTDRPVSFWMRWLPRQPAATVAEHGRGSAGSLAALAFRVLDEAGLEPRFAAVHTDPTLSFADGFASPIMFDSLAVVVTDGDGVDRWLVPGQAYDPRLPVPEVLAGRKALVMQRWVAERITGGGSCWPEFDMLHACFNASKALDTMELVTIAAAGLQPALQ